MNIAIINIYFGEERGGAAISTKLLVDELRKEQNVYIITSVQEKVDYNLIQLSFFKHFSPKVLRLNSKIIYARLSNEIETILKEIRPDIAHIQEFELMIPAIIAASRLNIPTVVTVRDHRFVCNLPCCESKGILNFYCGRLQYLKCLMKMSKKEFGFGLPGIFIWPLIRNKTKTIRSYLKKADSVIAISDFVRNNLIKIGIDETKISTIHNPAPDWKDKRVKKVEEKGKIIIFAPGRLEDYKGFHILIRAIAEVVQAKKDVKLIIAGNGTYENELKKLTRELNLDNNVEFAGTVPFDKIKELYFKSDIVVFPSIWPESFGRVSIEAMAAGKPVIASNIGGIPEVVTKDVGILVKPNDVDELTKAILKLVNNPKLRKSMGAKGSKYVKRFNVNDYCKKIMKLYETLL